MFMPNNIFCLFVCVVFQETKKKLIALAISHCVLLSTGFSVVPVFVWKCQRASPGRVVGARAGDSLIPMIGVTSVEIGATMPMTATALAREAVAAGEGKHMLI